MLRDDVQRQLLGENVMFVANRSFEVYLHQRYDYDEIERRMLVPFFGNRHLLRAEERDEAGKHQYALLERAGIRHPRQFASPDDIDRLVMVKAPHARVSFERAFFLASSPQEYRETAARLIDDGVLTEPRVWPARVDRGIRARPVGEPELLLLAAPGRARAERHRHAPADEPRGLAQRSAVGARRRARRADAAGRGRAHRGDDPRVDARAGLRHGRALRRGARGRSARRA